MPSGAIIHEEMFHECMALNNIATINSAHFHKLNSDSLCSCKFSPSKITHYTIMLMDTSTTSNNIPHMLK